VKVIVFCAMTYLLGAATILMGVGIADPAHLNGAQALNFGPYLSFQALQQDFSSHGGASFFFHERPVTVEDTQYPCQILACRAADIGWACRHTCGIAGPLSSAVSYG
jgi:hypothetical protein